MKPKKPCPSCGLPMSTVSEKDGVVSEVEPYCSNFACPKCWVHSLPPEKP